MPETPDILRQIVAYKQGELAAVQQIYPLATLQAQLAGLAPTRRFTAALRSAQASGRTAIIAEVKKGSPSKGTIRADFDPLAIARIYAGNGATCLSVLTDNHFFQGSLEYLALIRGAVDLPLLRKDFIFDPYQLYEARLAGADAVLLIAAMLDLAQLHDLAALARQLTMDVLLEVHDEAELEKALQVDVELIGVNNRNLSTFVVDLATTERLAPLVPAGRLLVAESGINARGDVERLGRAKASAFLVGEALMREADIGAKLRELLG